jgi:hypothetical protein
MAKARKPVGEVPSKTPTRTAAKAGFVQAARGDAVRVTPGAGGHNLGTPTYCTAKRAAPNVRSYS